MKYGAILADPPWSFRTYSGKKTTPHRCVIDYYPVMDKKSLEALPIADYASKNCALFMWAVDSHLDQAIDLMCNWGFSFKTIAFIWIKTDKFRNPTIGMGYWTRKSAEVCLLGTRGNIRRKNKGVRQVHMEPRREHSRKPDEFYRRIMALVDGPYLELFARQPWPEWASWGNETEKFVDELPLLSGLS